MLPAGDAELTVLHWNIHSWRALDGKPNASAVAALISELAPDVVSLVEVDESWGHPRCLRDIADRTGYAWVFVPSFTFGNTKPAGGFGNALLIRRRLAIRAFQQWDLLWPARVYDGTEPSEARTLLLTEVDAGAYRAWVGATHLPRGDEDARDAALKRIITLTSTLGDAWLICGDFNAPATAWVPGLMRVASTAPTYPADEPTEAIDYAVASASARVEAEVIPSIASDHMPVHIKATFM